MNLTFNNVVDVVQNLTLDEKEEIKYLLEKSIAEERRNEIFNNYLASKSEREKGGLKFSSNIHDLKKMLVSK